MVKGQPSRALRHSAPHQYTLLQCVCVCVCVRARALDIGWGNWGLEGGTCSRASLKLTVSSPVEDEALGRALLACHVAGLGVGGLALLSCLPCVAGLGGKGRALLACHVQLY